jgi:hypothetical protein
MGDKYTGAMVIPPGINNSWGPNYRRNGYSAGNHQFMHDESTGEMVILPGITNSWAANLPEKWLFHRELAIYGRRIYLRNGYSAGNYQFMGDKYTGAMVIPPGITNSWGPNYRRNGYSVANDQFRGDESTGEIAIPSGFTNSWGTNILEQW